MLPDFKLTQPRSATLFCFQSLQHSPRAGLCLSLLILLSPAWGSLRPDPKSPKADSATWDQENTGLSQQPGHGISKTIEGGE